MDYQRAESTIFGQAVNEIYTRLDVMTNQLVSSCQPSSSSTLSHTAAAMMVEAAEVAIERFRAENRRKADA